MKKVKIIYWITTGLVAAMMIFSAFSYFTNPEAKAGFEKMGFPDFFRIELGIGKLLGAIVLLVPALPQLIKQAAYVGFAIVFISAFVAHTALGDPISAAIMPLVFLAILLVSFRYQQKSLALAQ